jgi:hypothetical protein
MIRIREQRAEPESSAASRAAERDRGERVQPRDRECAERGKHERKGADGRGRSCDSQTPRTYGASGWEVREEGVELAVRPSRKQGLKPSFELLRVQPPLSRRLPQPFGNLLPISKFRTSGISPYQ